LLAQLAGDRAEARAQLLYAAAAHERWQMPLALEKSRALLAQCT
jgi:hypothetical protein